MSRDTTKTDDFGEDSAMEPANPFSGLRDADIALAIIGSIQAAVPSVPAEILEKVARSIRVLVLTLEIVEELADILKYHGLEVEAATSGADAIQKIDEIDDISVVCTDINMPGLEGLNLLRRIDEMFGTEREIVTLVLTGAWARSSADRCGSSSAKLSGSSGDAEAIVEELADIEDPGPQVEAATSDCAKFEDEIDDISVVCTDINMPGLEGLNLLRRIDEMFGTEREIVTLVLTARVGAKEAIEALRIGAVEFLAKPIAPKQFTDAVKHAQEIALSRIASRQLVHQLESQIDSVRKALSDCASPALVEQVQSSSTSPSQEGEMCEVTYLFTDVECFTSLSETMSPHALAQLLGEYVKSLCGFVSVHSGVVDKFMGDAVVARFGPAGRGPDFTTAAVTCALDIDDFARQFAAIQLESGITFGDTRIGVHTGQAHVGRIEGARRADFTAVGDTVNTASRLEGANKYFGTRICVSNAAAVRCRGSTLRPLGELIPKGETTGLSVYEPIRPQSAAARLLGPYSEAFRQLDDDPDGARESFANLRARWPDDPLVALYYQRLQSGIDGSRITFSNK